MQPSQPTKQFMASRKEAAAIIYNDYKEMQRTSFEMSSQLGRWLLGSLLLVHGGSLFGMFTFLSSVANNPAVISQYAGTVWWAVAGILLTLASGLASWLNWSMHSDNYDSYANKAMLWDPDEWVGKSVYYKSILATYWVSILTGIAAALCIVGTAASTLYPGWLSSTYHHLVG